MDEFQEMGFEYSQAVSVFYETYLFIVVKASNSNNKIHSQSLVKNLGGGLDKPAGIGCPHPSSKVFFCDWLV